MNDNIDIWMFEIWLKTKQIDHRSNRYSESRILSLVFSAEGFKSMTVETLVLYRQDLSPLLKKMPSVGQNKIIVDWSCQEKVKQTQWKS